MKTIEALISLVVLLSVIAAIDLRPVAVDSSLYQYQLAGDMWRVMQLRGSTHSMEAMTNDSAALGELTGLCVKINEDCEEQIVIGRTAYADGKAIDVRVAVGK